MDHLQSNQNARPWWADVEHLRDDAPTDRPSQRGAARSAAPTGIVDATTDRERSARSRAAAVANRTPARRPHRGDVARGSDWFEQEARHDGRRVKSTKTRQELTRPERPRATLIDVRPEHQALRRAQQVRRAPGERPTVTITGRPDAALPPQVREVKPIRARRTREGATSLVASPDRLILWAVALGLLMILASLGTASADAAALLP
ncbi:MAG: hypothetical protein JHD16_04905 [Solirubrobacteraceae bacterium]|nr:hypothetical protein [Solirubrobacteraceae bacterium]